MAKRDHGSRRAKYIHDPHCLSLTHDGECECPRPQCSRSGGMEGDPPPTPDTNFWEVKIRLSDDSRVKFQMECLADSTMDELADTAMMLLESQTTLSPRKVIKLTLMRVL